ncbi:MAG: dynamin family protein [Ornithinimicrobium sp.]
MSGRAMDRDAGSTVAAIIQDAEARAKSAESAQSLRDIQVRLEGPIRLAIAGKVKAGKSTLLNALIGEELAPTDAGECTQIVTWYIYGTSPRVRLFPVDGAAIERPYRRDQGALDIDLGGLRPDQVDHLEVTWPAGRLRETTLLDTPGLASISADVSARTEAVLTSTTDVVPVADAVLYLLRHAHSSDLRFLEAFESEEMLAGTSINTVGVLSRADEIGSCRLDAMRVAARVATRYASDPRIRRLCPTVLPVIGLVAHAAATLRESEFAALAAIAGAPAQESSQLLLTADRFADRESSINVPTSVRARLLERLGLFGVRLSVDLISNGACASATELSQRLSRECGIEGLREVLAQQFTARSRVLRVRSAVAAVRVLLQADACSESSPLLARLEQVVASDRDLDEIRLLESVRSGHVDLPEPKALELDRLLGGAGTEPATRLGVAPGEPAQVRVAAVEALGRWQRLAAHPLTPRATQRAARTVIRTLEAILMSSDASVSQA